MLDSPESASSWCSTSVWMCGWTVYCLAGRRWCWQSSRVYPLSPYMMSLTAILPLFDGVTLSFYEQERLQSPSQNKCAAHAHEHTGLKWRDDSNSKNLPCLWNDQLRTEQCWVINVSFDFCTNSQGPVIIKMDDVSQWHQVIIKISLSGIMNNPLVWSAPQSQ